NNITTLRTNGSTVIVDDIGYFAGPFFQDGVIPQAVDAAVAAGVPYFSAAGNEARQSYESDWRSGPVLASGSIGSAAGAPNFGGRTTVAFHPRAGAGHMQSLTVRPQRASTPTFHEAATIP